MVELTHYAYDSVMPTTDEAESVTQAFWTFSTIQHSIAPEDQTSYHSVTNLRLVSFM